MSQPLPDQHCAKGVKLLEAGQTEAALSQFSAGLTVAKRRNDRGALYYDIAVCHARMQRDVDALAALVQAVKAYPRILGNIRRGTDLSRLKATTEFAFFLQNATPYTTAWRWRSFGYVLVWVVVLTAYSQLCSPHKSDPGSLDFHSLAIAGGLGLLVEACRRIKRNMDAEADASFTQSMSRILQRNVGPSGLSPESPQQHKCPQCGQPYNPADYRQDAERILCSHCHAELAER